MYFDRKKYKKFARIQLKNRWAVPVLITLVIGLIDLLFTMPDYIKTLRNPDIQQLIYSDFESLKDLITAYNSIPKNNPMTPLMSIAQLLVSGILDVAAISVYLKMSRSPDKVSFSAFIEGLNNWARAILAVLWQFLWIYLWSLLLIIPGIIKSIAYSQMYYLINEHPNMSIPKSMKISMIITKGHKGELFVMYLSFLGWLILGTLTFGIGMLWIRPYIKMSMINAYHAMMKDALETGVLRAEDLA